MAGRCTPKRLAIRSCVSQIVSLCRMHSTFDLTVRRSVEQELGHLVPCGQFSFVGFVTHAWAPCGLTRIFHKISGPIPLDSSRLLAPSLLLRRIGLIAVFLQVCLSVAIRVVARLGRGPRTIVHVRPKPIHFEPVGQTVVIVITVFSAAEYGRVTEVDLTP